MTPQQHQELIKARISGSYSTATQRLSEEELGQAVSSHLEKGGKPAFIGEERNFGGKPYIKTSQGWRPKGHPVNSVAHSAIPKTTGTKEKEWWSKYADLKLNAYPLGVPQDQVKVNTDGDIHSHAVMTWKDPKTGMVKNAYTKEFLSRNADVKWQRISKVTDKKISTIKDKSLKILTGKLDAASKDAAAIVAIIAHTGLRRGNKGREAITGNKGVSTLSPENVTVKGDTISFDFIGKSYKENTATIKNKELAAYIAQKKAAGGEYLFETTDSRIDLIFDQVGGKGLKIKDMRTYVACDLAKGILYNDKDTPPPIPSGLTKAQTVKLVQDKLKSVYQQVSDRLNNTPTMTKTSYIHPNIIDSWLMKLDLGFEIKKGMGPDEELVEPTMEELFAQYPPTSEIVEIHPADEEECDEYNNTFEDE